MSKRITVQCDLCGKIETCDEDGKHDFFDRPIIGLSFGSFCEKSEGLNGVEDICRSCKEELVTHHVEYIKDLQGTADEEANRRLNEDEAAGMP